jgi:hypothetical protein
VRHTLDLRGNALDSLNEGLRRYTEAHQGEVRAYKFAVLHFAHFIELLLKFAVSREHPLLIYAKPNSKNLNQESTIGLWDAVHILRNAGRNVDTALLDDLEWLKKLRNQIEHYAFDLEVKQVRAVLGRILRAANDFVESTGLDPLESELDPDALEVFERLLDEYKERLANAQADARDESGRSDPTYCSYCGEQDVAIPESGELKCYFCGETEPFVECAVCTESYREDETRIWNDDDPDAVSWICVYCEDNIFGD